MPVAAAWVPPSAASSYSPSDLSPHSEATQAGLCFVYPHSSTLPLPHSLTPLFSAPSRIIHSLIPYPYKGGQGNASILNYQGTLGI